MNNLYCAYCTKSITPARFYDAVSKIYVEKIREFTSYLNFTNLSGSSGSLCCFNSSRPLMTGAERPGHNILIFPTPMTWPRFKSRILILPAPLPRPFLAPALLTEVTDFHNFSAGTMVGK